jgi:N-acetyl-anhydromuramyl-L-alanine amidase AmpD
VAQSPEYPDLTWVPPKSWTKAGRTSVQLVVIHDTEGSEGLTSAEDGAAYDQRRTDGTSTHYFHDADSTVQCVRTEDLAHAARAQGNRRGIQHELCGKASQGAAGWADPVSQGTLRQAARQVARDCKKWGIPARKLSADQVGAGWKGICGHVDITNAFPQDNGTHTDPGPAFPWPAFLKMVQAEMEDDSMAGLTAADVQAAAKAGFISALSDAYTAAMGKASADTPADKAKRNVRDFLRAVVGGPTADVDEVAVAAAVLAGLNPQLIAAAIPAGLAREVADELATRLAS